MRGRNIAELIREIDDIVEAKKASEDNSILLSLDFQKTFDTISIPLIMESFKKFGFGPHFIDWLKVLTTNRTTSIKNAGFLSQEIQLERGVRQGCSIFPLLFTVAVEVLAIAIKQSRKIEGIDMGGGRENAKIRQYADDTTFLLNNISDMRNALHKVEEFSSLSGLMLNREKSKAMYLCDRNPENRDGQIEFVNELKLLAIYFSNKKTSCENEKNWSNILESIK